MIRTIWVGLNLVLSTLFFGMVAIVASLLRVRGRIYFWATQQWSRAMIWASDSPVITHGLDGLDWDQPLVLVANHRSDYDIFAIAAVLPRPFAFVAKKELERVPIFGSAWKAAGHISIDRSDRRLAIQSLRQAGAKIRRERSTVIIFPEGTRSRTGELQPFKKGAFVLAMEAGVPVVPVAIHGSDLVFTPGTGRIRPGPIHVHFSTPLLPADFGDRGTDALSAAVRERIEALLATAGAAHRAG